MSTLKVNRIEPRTGDSVEIVGLEAPAASIKAWVNFQGTGVDGTGNVAIRGEMNVSSITDNGISDYTVNFKTAMVDANYAISGTAGVNTTSLKAVCQPFTLQAPTTAAVRIQCPQSDGGMGSDARIVFVSIIR